MVGSAWRNRWQQPAQRVLALLLCAGCAFLLVSKAETGVRSTDSLSSSDAVDRAARQTAFYDCLDAQVRRLLPAGAAISFAGGPSSAQAVTLLNAAGNYLTVAAKPSQALLVLGLAPGSGVRSCSGVVLTAKRGEAAS
ncbi:MAG: hypothetical protein WAM97_10825 [Acidimicrobiales bacterium]|jgi:hypothetical protein